MRDRVLNKRRGRNCRIADDPTPYKPQSRSISTYFDRALMPLRELIEYLEGLENGKS